MGWPHITLRLVQVCTRYPDVIISSIPFHSQKCPNLDKELCGSLDQLGTQETERERQLTQQSHVYECQIDDACCQ